MTRIEVRSNLSLTLDRLAGFFLVLSAVTLTVALLPTLLGYWPVMAVAIVYLALHGTRIEIGSFVPVDERIEVANCIIRALEPHSAWNTKGIKETASPG